MCIRPHDEILRICTEFVNDPDTTVGMECDWHEFLVKEVTCIFSKSQIMHALDVITDEYIVPLEVTHDTYGKMFVYIAIYDEHIVISTRERLLQ